MTIAIGVIAGILTATVITTLIAIISAAIGNRSARRLDHPKKTVRFFAGFGATTAMLTMIASPLIGLLAGVTACVKIIGL